MDNNFPKIGASQEESFKLPLNIIVVALKDMVVFPSMIVTVYLKNLELIKAIESASLKKELIGLVSQVNPNKPVPPTDNLYRAGTSATILQIIKSSESEAMVLVEGISRIKIQEFIQSEPYTVASISPISAADNTNMDLQAGVQEIKEYIRKASFEGKELPPEFINQLHTLTQVDEIADLACSFLTLDPPKKQELLEIEDAHARMKRILDALNKEVELLKIRKKIHTDISQELNKTERDFMLRQELKAIKKELGNKESMIGLDGMTDESDIKQLQKQIRKSGMPKEVEKIAMKELDRLKKIVPISPEYTVSRTYIEWLCDMPWNKRSKAEIDVKQARAILDEDHYGLEKVKERILEFLAVCQLNKSHGATILCFVGPPGVGKTSLGQSIAKAMGRAFMHTSLGGIRDEADIRGHRRTYVGALPGRIIQNIKRSACMDPVFMLDEIDKIGKDFQGDPASALLEVLDPEQNFAFTDHYLDVPFDLSKVFFILTANFLDPIPPALLDRMEIIELPGYTEEEKLQIAKKYLIPKQLKANGIENKNISLTDEAILLLIRSYTNEAGLRDLERQIAAISRKIAKNIVEGRAKISKVNREMVQKLLGVEKFIFEAAQENDMVGVTTGLAWTPYGGDIIFIEATKMKGSKNLTLTGNLGEVMQESAKAALSLIRSNAKKFGIDESVFEKTDIHIHVPEGATPKDGPSAGITICTSLISLFTGRKVRRDVAMTGEITLSGRILPIGGLKEKILAARRARMKTIIIPEKNRKDLTEIPAKVLNGLKIVYASSLEDVVKTALLNKKAAKNRTKRRSKKKVSVKLVKIPIPDHK